MTSSMKTCSKPRSWAARAVASTPTFGRDATEEDGPDAAPAQLDLASRVRRVIGESESTEESRPYRRVFASGRSRYKSPCDLDCARPDYDVQSNFPRGCRTLSVRP